MVGCALICHVTDCALLVSGHFRTGVRTVSSHAAKFEYLGASNVVAGLFSCQFRCTERLHLFAYEPGYVVKRMLAALSPKRSVINRAISDKHSLVKAC